MQSHLECHGIMPPTSGLLANGGKPSHVCVDVLRRGSHTSAEEATEKDSGSASTGLEAKPADVTFSRDVKRQRLVNVREIRD